jgi:hypothetical protein
VSPRARFAVAVACIALAVLVVAAYFAAYLHSREIVDQRMETAAAKLATDLKDVSPLQIEAGSHFPEDVPIHSVKLESGRVSFEVEVESWHLDYGCVTAVVQTLKPVRLEKTHRPC